MSRHTPGPWQVHNGYRVYAPAKLVGENRGQYFEVAICGTDYASGNLAETDANARLIAAAPDLLAACQAGLVKIQRLCQELGRPTDLEAQQLHDAITKAEAV